MGFLAIIFPLICLLLLSLVLKNKIQCGEKEWKYYFIISSILLSAVVAIITEILSIFTAINQVAVLLFWIICSLALLILCQKLKCYQDLDLFLKAIKSSFIKIIDSKLIKVIVISLILFVLLLTLITAIVSPPNSFDGMTYHYSRVMHWIQNQSLDFYPTNIERQLYFAPLAEIFQLHLYLLSGGDHLANLVQWFSMLGSLLVLSLIAKALGAKSQGRLITIGLAAVIPMGLLQSNSTQNDYVLSFYVLVFMLLAIKIIKDKKVKRRDVVLLAISLSLALFTKGTAYFYVLPVIVWLIINKINWIKDNPKKVIQYLIIIIALVIGLNSGHLWRNKTVYDNFLITHDTILNQIHGPRYLASNIIRNIALHSGSPFMYTGFPIDKINQSLEYGVKAFHDLIKIDINDASITYPGHPFTFHSGLHTSENYANNTLHALLIFLVIILYLARKKYRNTLVSKYLLASLATLLLYCFLIRWDPWAGRLHLSFFLLLMPFSGYVIEKSGKTAWQSGLILFFIVFSYPWILHNDSAPLLASTSERSIWASSRESMYFEHQSELEEDYVKAVELIRDRKCNRVGIISGFNGFEYPIWVLMHQGKFDKNIQIEHLGVMNPSIRSANDKYRQFKPCAILLLHKQNKDYYHLDEKKYQLFSGTKYIDLYLEN